MAGAGFVSTFTVFGLAYSFGAFFRPISVEFGSSRAATSVVFSATVFVYAMLGMVTGQAADRYGVRPMLVAGGLSLGAGLALTALASRLWMVSVCFGLGVGVAVACGWVPMLAFVSRWFSRYRSMGLGAAVTGVGCGTLAVPTMAALLIETLGWRRTCVVLGAGGAALLLGCAWVTREPPGRVRGTASQVSLAATVRSAPFGILYLASLLFSMALFVPMVYLPPFAQERGFGRVAASALVGFVGAASVLGRVALGILGARADTIRLFQASFLVMALSFIIWLDAGSYLWLVLFTLAMGTAYGGAVTLSPLVVAELFGLERLGTIIGILYTSLGVGTLLVLPVAGYLVDRTGSYRWAVLLAMGLAWAAFAALLPLRSRAAAARGLGR
jgi:MFS family permease